MVGQHDAVGICAELRLQQSGLDAILNVVTKVDIVSGNDILCLVAGIPQVVPMYVTQVLAIG
jgi:hypothetical protein